MKTTFVTLCCALFLQWGKVAVSAAEARAVRSTAFERFFTSFELLTDFVRARHTQPKGTLDGGLQLIGAGFSRTGTKSTEAALHQLGHQIYDIRSMTQYRHGPVIVQCAKEYKQGNTATCLQWLEDIESKGYTATLDAPINLLAVILSELRPEAKVLFNVRDDEWKWVASLKGLLQSVSHLEVRPWSWIVHAPGAAYDLFQELYDFELGRLSYPETVSRPLPWFEIPGERSCLSSDRTHEWVELHQRFEKELYEKIPSDRLLKFNVKQGWEPLVRFLNLDPKLAEEDFPYANDMKSVQRARAVMDVFAATIPLWFGLVVYCFYKCLRFIYQRARSGTIKMKSS